MSFKKNLTVSALAIGVISAVSMAHADQAGGSYYVGGSLGRAFNSMDKRERAESKADGYTHEMNKLGLKGFAGYNLNKSWAVESGFAYLGKPTSALKSPVTSYSGSATVSALYVAGIFSAPMAENISGFAKAGLSLNRVSAEGTGTEYNRVTQGSARSSAIHPMLGVGMSYAINKNLAVRGELEYFGRIGKSSESALKSTLLSAGVIYSF